MSDLLKSWLIDLALINEQGQLDAKWLLLYLNGSYKAIIEGLAKKLA